MMSKLGAVCVVAVPKIGQVYIPGMPSKEAVLAGIQNVRKQSDTECKHKQISTLAFQNSCVFVRKFLKK